MLNEQTWAALAATDLVSGMVFDPTSMVSFHVHPQSINVLVTDLAEKSMPGEVINNLFPHHLMP